MLAARPEVGDFLESSPTPRSVEIRVTGHRVRVELRGKLLGVVVMHWAVLLGGDLLAGASPWKVINVVREYGSAAAGVARVRFDVVARDTSRHANGSTFRSGVPRNSNRSRSGL